MACLLSSSESTDSDSSSLVASTLRSLPLASSVSIAVLLSASADEDCDSSCPSFMFTSLFSVVMVVVCAGVVLALFSVCWLLMLLNCT
eukprot:2540646-Ditylum_brightwellii.AAC.1